jgi:hypothetical protein
VSSLAAPALLADRYGTAAYASIAGILALPVTISRAAAPLAAAALLLAARNYHSLLIAVAICCAVAAAGMFLRAGSSPPDATNADDREAGKAGDWQRWLPYAMFGGITLLIGCIAMMVVALAR